MIFKNYIKNTFIIIESDRLTNYY